MQPPLPHSPSLLLRALLYQEWTVGAAPQQQLSVFLTETLSALPLLLPLAADDADGDAGTT